MKVVSICVTIFCSILFFTHVLAYSQKSKPALVLIHAFPTDHRLFQPQMQGLKTQFDVITLDLKGFGNSKLTTGNAISMNEYALQVKNELDQRHIQKAIIGGESMGGYVALAFLKNYPERVNGLILSNTQSISDNAKTKEKREILAQEVLANGTEKFISDFLPKALSPNADKHVVINLQKMMQAQQANAMASALRGMALREDLSGVLSKVTIPVLILTGDKDSVISPEQSKNMHELAKGSKLVNIAGAGHLSNLEKPHEWNQAVKDFFLPPRIDKRAR